MNRITSAGYAIRTPDPTDRRKVLFATTSEGAELSLAARILRNAWLETRLRGLSSEDRKVLAHACTPLDDIAES